MQTDRHLRVILALSLVTHLGGAMGLTASAQPPGLPTVEECEQAKLKAGAAEASTNGAVQSARDAEEVAFAARRGALAADFRVSDADLEVEAAQRKLTELTEAARRGYALAPDPSEAARDYARKLMNRDRAKELADDARVRAADRQRDAETARSYAIELRAAAEQLKKVSQDLCTRLQPAK